MRPACMADYLTAICELILQNNVGTSTSHNPMGLHGLLQGSFYLDKPYSLWDLMFSQLRYQFFHSPLPSLFPWYLPMPRNRLKRGCIRLVRFENVMAVYVYTSCSALQFGERPKCRGNRSPQTSASKVRRSWAQQTTSDPVAYFW
jgi:hypothetical protein